MIRFITWPHFLVAIGGLTLLYYFAILLLYYRSEIQTFFTPNIRPPQPDAAANPVQTVFMGDPEFEGQETVTAESLVFAVPEDDDEAEPPAVQTAEEAFTQVLLLGPVADFLKELKSGFGLLKEAQGSKEDFFTLLGILSEKYSPVMQSTYRPLLEVFILEMAAEQLPFPLTLEELQNPSL